MKIAYLILLIDLSCASIIQGCFRRILLSILINRSFYSLVSRLKSRDSSKKIDEYVALSF